MELTTSAAPPGLMSNLARLPGILRSRLVVRVTLAIGLGGVGLAFLFATLGAPFIQDYEYKRNLTHIGDLLTTVENTARIACFTGDKTLATEVARGLMSNGSIAAVRVTSGDQVLVDIRKVSLGRADLSVVRRAIASPFDERMQVGEVILTPDSQFIQSQANAYSRFFTGLMLLEVLAVTAVVALAMLRMVVQPITQFADTLRSIEGNMDEYLPTPKGNEDNEIGHLAYAFNRMIDSMANLLDQEHALSEKMARSEQRFRTLAENSPDIIARFSPCGDLMFANAACSRETGLSSAVISPGSPIPPKAWRPTMSLEQFKARIAQIIATGSRDRMYWEWETDGALICHEIHMVAEYEVSGAPIGALAIGRNISERRQAERLLVHQATHDALTGLPNRVLLKDRLQHAVAQGRREGRQVGVIFTDLDNFKDVNDSLGHDVGDELLKMLAQRMRSALRESDTVARLGGDEFVAVIENAANNHDLDAVVQKLFETLSQPCDIAGHRIFPGASLGIAAFPKDGDDADTLMRNADTAMYAAKDGGRNHFRFFSADMNAELSEWMEISASLRNAIENHELEVHYQPKACLKTGELHGMEALVRWRHPEHGLIPPARFIPVAEKSGLIGAIGAWVLDDVCRQARTWLDAGLHPGRVAVNLSTAQCHGHDLVDLVRSALSRHGLSGHHLELEITESIVMDDAEESIRAFWALRDMDVRVSVDDFGTGYSSLSYLKRLPVDVLKIDKSFVDDIETDTNDVEIIRAIIAMAHSLNLDVVAEGVETAPQLDCLRAAGCDQLQGYYFSRPLPADKMTALLRNGGRLTLPGNS